MRESKENTAKSKEAKHSWSERSFDLVLNRLMSEPTLSIGSHTARLTRASTSRAQTHTDRGISKCARGKIGDWETTGWMGWKRIKLSVINNAVWSPHSSFYAGTVAHTRVSRRSKILTSARNDSINNASSAIALNTYPVSVYRTRRTRWRLTALQQRVTWARFDFADNMPSKAFGM